MSNYQQTYSDIEHILLEDVTSYRHLNSAVKELGSLTDSEFVNGLTYLILRCVRMGERKRKVALVALTDAFRVMYPNDVTIPLQTYVFTFGMLPDEFSYGGEVIDVLSVYASCFPQTDYYTHAVALFNYSIDQDICVVLKRLGRVFEKDSTAMVNTFRLILNHVEEYSNEFVDLPYHRQYYMDRLKSCTTVPLKNEFIADIDIPLVENNYRLPTQSVVPVGISNDSLGMIINKAASMMKSLKGEELNEEELALHYNSLLPEETQTFDFIDSMVAMELNCLDELLSNEEVDIDRRTVSSNMSYVPPTISDDLYRRYGPCNPRLAHYGIVNEEDPCTLHGGCRMLTCWEFIEIDEDEEEITPYTRWFQGSCDRCCRKIMYKHEAVRMPLSNGGWFGCYCSWNCVENDTDDVMIQASCKKYRGEYEKLFIYDREYHEHNLPSVTDEKIRNILASLESTL